MKYLSIFLIATSLLMSCSPKEAMNSKQLFDFDWKFAKGEQEGAESIAFNDSDWQQVDLPHDMSIEGPFSKDNPAFSRGAWLPTGKCAYRKTFEVEATKTDKRFVIYFDGAYRNSEVYINGNLLGKRPLGYIAFYYDMTKYINIGGENTLTVLLDNSVQPGSRWYTGTGIYRHVYLIETDKLYVPLWGSYIVSNEFTKAQATLKIETKVQNDFAEDQNFKVRYSAIDTNGEKVASTIIDQFIEANSNVLVKANIDIANPELWSMQSPYLYTIKTELLLDNKLVYSEDTKTGIRSLAFDSKKGFLLNGKVVKLKGVCLHHAGGPLGAAIYERTVERQLEKLREMGCNAIRTAHNPFSEEFLDVCDRMGFLVMNEMFDEWEQPKTTNTIQNGKKIRIPIDFYASQFKEWADRDMTDFVLRDRNHASVIMWSIGNEIQEMFNEEGAPIGKRLAKIVHDLDYRPVTNGVVGYGRNRWPNDDAVATSDIKGYNYIKDDGFKKERNLFPEAMAIVTETQSAQSFYPRATYLYGENKQAWWNELNYENVEAQNWGDSRGYLGEIGMKAWAAVKNRPYVMGQFIWTGWDYLGEVIPFGWPARSSSFAPIDLCGFPKDGYYFYQSQWSDEPMVHIFPHWNHEGHEGDTLTVYAYTNGDEVELFQDGKSLGKQANNTDSVEYQQWNVVYKPGSLKVLAYRDGNISAEKTISTAGQATTIKMHARRNTFKANNQDLIYVECSILDAEGNFVPNADNSIEFIVEGPAELLGVGNGNNMSHESFKGTSHKAFNGHCLAIIKSTKEVGEIKVTAKSEGLSSKILSFSATQ